MKKEQEVFLIFTVAGKCFALPADVIERVVAAAETLPVPGAPSFLRGVLNCGGEPVSVIDLRGRFGLPVREIQPSDRFIFVKNGEAMFAFLAETVEGVRSLYPGKITLPESSLRLSEEKFQGALVGMAQKEERIVLIQTVETLFSMTGADIRQIENLCSFPEEGVL